MPIGDTPRRQVDGSGDEQPEGRHGSSHEREQTPRRRMAHRQPPAPGGDDPEPDCPRENGGKHLSRALRGKVKAEPKANEQEPGAGPAQVLVGYGLDAAVASENSRPQ